MVLFNTPSFMVSWFSSFAPESSVALYTNSPFLNLAMTPSKGPGFVAPSPCVMMHGNLRQNMFFDAFHPREPRVRATLDAVVWFDHKNWMCRFTNLCFVFMHIDVYAGGIHMFLYHQYLCSLSETCVHVELRRWGHCIYIEWWQHLFSPHLTLVFQILAQNVFWAGCSGPNTSSQDVWKPRVNDWGCCHLLAQKCGALTWTMSPALCLALRMECSSEN